MQVVVGMSGGCEAAMNAARRFLDSMDEDQIFVKLDFANAFNCLQRPQVGGACRSWDVNEIIYMNNAKEIMFYEIYFIKYYYLF